MKIRILVISIALFTYTGFAAANCNREELRSTVDTYFEALAAHDVKAVSLARKVKFTENGVSMKAGEGFWKTAEKVTFSRNVLDIESCGTVTQALIQENGRDIIFAVRLKLNDKKQISEIEHIIAREQDFAFRPEGVLLPEFVNWEEILPKAERTSRAAMIAGSNDYFDMFVEDADVNVPFSNTCHRWENGTHTTRRGNCSPRDTGLVIIHPHRRVPVVDRETGVAAAFVFFAGSLPDVHLFKFRNGQVEYAQAVIGSQAETIGWPDDTSLSRRTPPQGETMSRALNATEEGEN